MHHSVSYNTLGFKKIKKRCLKMWVSDYNVLYNEAFVMVFSVMKLSSGLTSMSSKLAA